MEVALVAGPLKSLAGIVASMAQIVTEAEPSAEGLPESDLLTELQSWVSWERVQDVVMTYGPSLLKGILVLVIGRFVARWLTTLMVRAARKARVDETLLRFMENGVYLLLLVVVGIAALQTSGVETTSLSAVLAAAGFAVAMALQGSLANFAAGIMLVLFKPFRVGEFVELKGTSGTVVEIQIFNTILRSGDNVRIIVPNSAVTGNEIKNFSAEKTRRIDLVVGCGYNDDLKAVRAFLEEIVQSDARICKEPAPKVAVSELADSSVNFVVRPWVASADYWGVRWDLLERIKMGFDDRGFTIPFPSQDVFMHRSEAA